MKRSLEITESIQSKINSFWLFVVKNELEVKWTAAGYMPDHPIFLQLRRKLSRISTLIEFRTKLDPDTNILTITFTGGGRRKLIPKSGTWLQ